MSFVNRLLEKFRAPKATEEAAEHDVFTLRLMKMQGRAARAPQHTPFKNSRLHPAT
ncbi:MAG: hypothetical protein JNN06_16015 [Gemmobacter sp.]|uniref:hypothetical protein n=1 Tax=Gemmobacter sp. TaxID=1898957 RepID=UPI001A645DC2|nr:hypothetical protein [Gemmobacter sp.]MBL8563776.1 hypothetical protein [Gemmobacter sp.]